MCRVSTPIGSAKGINHADRSPGRLTVVDRTDTAHGELTKTALKEETRFTIEHHALFSTVIRSETVFENEADRQAIAELFSALETPTGAGSLTRLHFKGISVFTKTVSVNVVVTNTRIDDTVKLNVSSESGTGKSAENCNSSQSLFHDLSPTHADLCMR